MIAGDREGEGKELCAWEIGRRKNRMFFVRAAPYYYRSDRWMPDNKSRRVFVLSSLLLFFSPPLFSSLREEKKGEMEGPLRKEERNCITTRQIRRMGKSCKRIQFIRSFSWERNSSTDIFNRSIDKKISVGVIGWDAREERKKNMYSV